MFCVTIVQCTLYMRSMGSNYRNQDTHRFGRHRAVRVWMHARATPFSLLPFNSINLGGRRVLYYGVGDVTHRTCTWQLLGNTIKITIHILGWHNTNEMWSRSVPSALSCRKRFQIELSSSSAVWQRPQQLSMNIFAMNKLTRRSKWNWKTVSAFSFWPFQYPFEIFASFASRDAHDPMRWNCGIDR